MSGTLTKAQMAKMMEGLNQFDGGLTFTHHSVTAEDDRVAVLTVVDAKLKDGRAYHNNIFFLFIIKDGNDPPRDRGGGLLSLAEVLAGK